MRYSQWHKKTLKNIAPITETSLYFRTLIFSLGIFAATFAYVSWLKTPNIWNKSVADTAIILIGLSMLLSGICYFWNILDTKIIYRKHLGLIGAFFGLAHLGLSLTQVMSIFASNTWTKGIPWNWLTGLGASLIFGVMVVISNQYSALHLGGKNWRGILRTGYLAVILILAHVILLKSGRWLTWYQSGMTSLPSMSLIVTGFMLIVILMRLALGWSLMTKSKYFQKK